MKKIIKIVLTVILVIGWLGSCSAYSGLNSKYTALETADKEKEGKIEELNSKIADLEKENQKLKDEKIDSDLNKIVSDYKADVNSYTQNALDLINNTDFSSDTLFEKAYQKPNSDEYIYVTIYKIKSFRVTNISIEYGPEKEDDETVYEYKVSSYASNLAYILNELNLDKFDVDFDMFVDSGIEVKMSSKEIQFTEKDGTIINDGNLPEWMNKFKDKDQKFYDKYNNIESVKWVIDTMKQIREDITPYIK